MIERLPQCDPPVRAFDPFASAPWQPTPAASSTGPRIGVVGAPGVGKTTLARALASSLGITLIPELARDGHAAGLPLGSATTMPAQAALWLAQLTAERYAGSYVADRTLVDVVVHADMALDRGCDHVEALLHAAISSATLAVVHAHYDLFLFLSTEWELLDDGIRDTNQVFREQFSAAMMSRLGRLDIPWAILDGTLDQRLRRAVEAVERLPIDRAARGDS